MGSDNPYIYIYIYILQSERESDTHRRHAVASLFLTVRPVGGLRLQGSAGIQTTAAACFHSRPRAAIHNPSLAALQSAKQLHWNGVGDTAEEATHKATNSPLSVIGIVNLSVSHMFLVLKL